jgi:hypothetical protein
MLGVVADVQFDHHRASAIQAFLEQGVRAVSQDEVIGLGGVEGEAGGCGASETAVLEQS